MTKWLQLLQLCPAKEEEVDMVNCQMQRLWGLNRHLLTHYIFAWHSCFSATNASACMFCVDNCRLVLRYISPTSSSTGASSSPYSSPQVQNCLSSLTILFSSLNCSILHHNWLVFLLKTSHVRIVCSLSSSSLTTLLWRTCGRGVIGGAFGGA